jgi:hypothetical protein
LRVRCLPCILKWHGRIQRSGQTSGCEAVGNDKGKPLFAGGLPLRRRRKFREESGLSMEGRQNLRKYFGRPVSPPAGSLRWNQEGAGPQRDHSARHASIFIIKAVEDGGPFICIAPSVRALQAIDCGTAAGRQISFGSFSLLLSSWLRTVMGSLVPDKSLILV